MQRHVVIYVNMMPTIVVFGAQKAIVILILIGAYRLMAVMVMIHNIVKMEAIWATPDR